MLSPKNISRNKVQIISRAVERLEEENECFGFPHEKVISDPWSGGGRINTGMDCKGGKYTCYLKKKKKTYLFSFSF